MSIALELGLIFLLILVNGVFAMGEMALVSARRARLAAMEAKGVPGARAARKLADDPQHFLPTVQVGVTLVSILTGTFGGTELAAALTPAVARLPYVGQAAGAISLALVVLAITFATLVLGELVPKQIALRRPEMLAAGLARPIALLSTVTAPIVWLLGRASHLVLDLLGLANLAKQTVTEEELKALLAEGTQAGVLESEERDMIERLLRLADKPVRAIMTPRTEIAWVDRTDPRRDIVLALKAAPHSRFVVCDGSIDNVVGVVQAKDLLDRILDGKDLSVAASLRQPIVVPDTVTAFDALERLKSDPLGMALVMDEYGSFEGVVTAADVLQAIIGDVAEPGYALPAEAADPQGGDLTFDGMTPVDELKLRLKLPDLPAEGSYHTLAGLLLALLRRVPQAGDRMVFGGWLFEVLEMDNRRVVKVRARRETLAEA
ncbi:MAG TPA: hemolysin family protein [Acetobacteraceae bacterium]|nr:hemolysin family protein [Acetobacteraceae bacterium]